MIKLLITVLFLLSTMMLNAQQCGNTLTWQDPSCQVPGSGTLDTNKWSIVSRHGEYAQSETECNEPNAISVDDNGLHITTSASPYTCGDFNVDGTTRTPPASWPYDTGDVQWNTFNFQYGTVTWQSQYPNPNATVWPSHWFLTSLCQNENKFSGDTGFGGCPNFGDTTYDEIDGIECITGGCGFNIYHGSSQQRCFIAPQDASMHTWMMIRTSSSVQLFEDGSQKCNITSGIPTANMFMLIQTQTGGVAGTPNNSLLPVQLTTTYVKVCNTTDGSCATVPTTDPSVTFYDGFTSTVTVAPPTNLTVTSIQ